MPTNDDRTRRIITVDDETNSLPASVFLVPGTYTIGANGQLTFVGAPAAALVKPADTSRNVSVASADPDLVANLAAGSYSVDGYISFTAPAAGGLKAALFASQAIPTALYGIWRSQAGSTATVAVIAASTPGTLITNATQIDDASGNAGAFFIKGKIIVPSLTQVLLTWAQQAASGNTVLQAGSWLQFNKLA